MTTTTAVRTGTLTLSSSLHVAADIKNDLLEAIKLYALIFNKRWGVDGLIAIMSENAGKSLGTVHVSFDIYRQGKRPEGVLVINLSADKAVSKAHCRKRHLDNLTSCVNRNPKSL